MPIDIVPKVLYPVVPQLPGVPALLRSGATILDTATFGIFGFGDILNDIIGTNPEKWGIFDDGGQAIAEFDSIYTFDFNNTSSILEYPVEEGGFATFNKVQNSYDIQVVINCGGSDARRSACLQALNAASQSLDLYSVFTPTDTIINANVIGVSYSNRAAEGATILTAHLTLKEVRKTATANMPEPSEASAFSPRAQGQIQTVDDVNLFVSGFV